MKIEGPDPHPDPNPDPDLLVRGMDPRIRIHTKMSWIRNTAAGGYERIARQSPGPRPRRAPRRWLPAARFRDDARRPRQANREHPRAPARPADELRLVSRAHDRPRLTGDQEPVQPGGGRGDDQRDEAEPPAIWGAGRPAVAGPERQPQLAPQSQLAQKQ
jgi:hypothetical protein